MSLFNFFSNPRYNERLKDPKIIKTVYHELGHLYIALLFDSDFKVSKCVIGKENISTLTGKNDWNGGVSYDLNMSLISKSINLSDKFICICFGGMCSQNLHFTEISEFQNKIQDFLLSPKNNMNNEGGIQDFDSAKQFLINNEKILNKIHIDYLREILAFNFNYLSDQNVWKSIQLFAEKILRKKNMVLDRKDILKIIKKIEFDLYLEKNRDIILSSRYPL